MDGKATLVNFTLCEFTARPTQAGEYSEEKDPTKPKALPILPEDLNR